MRLRFVTTNQGKLDFLRIVLDGRSVQAVGGSPSDPHGPLFGPGEGEQKTAFRFLELQVPNLRFGGTGVGARSKHLRRYDWSPGEMLWKDVDRWFI